MPSERSWGVWAAAGFFALGGVLEFTFAAWFAPRPPGFWDLWDALGRSILYIVVAAGLWRRIAVFRSLASIYCIVILLTYAAVLVIAYCGMNAVFPKSLILGSLYEIPSCVLLLPYLRSPEASATFSRPFFHS
ncbi:MAG TPA: hypothetical protein VN083_10990 [Vicinamibacteria bacterium]|jgi:hypothetical protein|nr:hypothetical protein [Vicinamibacteria bacterium]